MVRRNKTDQNSGKSCSSQAQRPEHHQANAVLGGQTRNHSVGHTIPNVTHASTSTLTIERGQSPESEPPQAQKSSVRRWFLTTIQGNHTSGTEDGPAYVLAPHLSPRVVFRLHVLTLARWRVLTSGSVMLSPSFACESLILVFSLGALHVIGRRGRCGRRSELQ